MSARTVLVTGATGNQGGAVTDALLEKGMQVRALVRDPSESKAKILLNRGVEVVKGDLDEQRTVEAAAKGVDAVFILTTPFAPGVGIEGEIRQGRTIIDALRRSNVPHVVYSSVGDADRNTGVPHFDSKADGERYLTASGLPATITAPVFFADNVLFPWNIQDLSAGRFRQALPADRKLQMVSLRDIGRFNAAIIERGPEMAGRRINYAGDELTPKEMTAVLAATIGRQLEYELQPMGEVRAMSEDMESMYKWFDRVGFSADITGLRREFPEVGWLSFAQWAETQDCSQVTAAGK